MLKKIQKEVEDLRVKVYAGQSLEDTEKALYEIEQMLFKAMDEQLNIPIVVRSGKIDSINAEFTKARKDFAKACNNYLNSKEHKAMIEAFKKVGAIS